MIPYFHFPTYKLFSYPFEIYGILMALGMYLAQCISRELAEREGLDPIPMQDLAYPVTTGGLVTAHLAHVAFYHPEELTAHGALQILTVWDGLSSLGGIGGGVLIIWFYFSATRIPFERYADILAIAVTTGWAIARIGCFMVHDHPGARTTFFAAVDFPTQYWGGPRHDLGLYEAMGLFTLTGALCALRRLHLLRHRLMALLALSYGAMRFWLDSLRATDLPYVDARYLGLTAAQYGCILAVAYGVWRLIRGHRRGGGRDQVPAPSA